jgi:hypothetical protein
MRKKILVLLLLIFSLSTLYSLEEEFSLSLGVLGLGFNSDFETAGGYGNGRFLNFMYQSSTGLGFSLSPLVFFHNDMDNQSLTFVNGSLFYNFLIKTHVRTGEGFFLGPSIAVNAVRSEDPTFVEFRSGLFFSLRLFDILYTANNRFAIDIFFVELGYKYNKIDRHGFYAHIGFDLVAMIQFIGGIIIGREYEDYRKNSNPPWQF